MSRIVKTYSRNPAILKQAHKRQRNQHISSGQELSLRDAWETITSSFPPLRIDFVMPVDFPLHCPNFHCCHGMKLAEILRRDATLRMAFPYFSRS